MDNPFLDIISPLFEIETFDLKQTDKIETACKAAIEHNLFMLVYSQLKGDKSIDFLNKHHNAYFQAVGRAIKQEVLEKKIIDLLKSKSIPSLSFKGNALARDVYQKRNIRNSADIDILIKSEDIADADKILKQAGYKSQETGPLDFWATRKHHAVYQCPETSIIIEMHWNFCIPGFFNLTSEDIWKNVLADEKGNLSLNPEINLIQLFIHNSMHAYKEFRISVDILWAMYRYNDLVNWTDSTKTLKKIGLLKTAYISLHQINQIWGDKINGINSIEILFNEVKKQMFVKPILLSKFFNYDLTKRPVYNHNREQFFVRLSLDSPLVILKSFIKSFIPSINEIKSFYNDKRNWRLPLNYIRFISWRVLEWIK